MYITALTCYISTNPYLGLKTKNSNIEGHRQDMKILCVESGSTVTTSLDAG